MKTYKPTTPSRRGMSGIDFARLSRKRPEKSLTVALRKNAGRSRSSGRITVRHQGGGAKRRYRMVAFAQTRMHEPATVVALEYDPNRTAFIALIRYRDGQKQYVLAPQDLQTGDEMVCSPKADLKPGNRMQLMHIPVGTSVYNIELQPGRGGVIVRSAGSSAQVLAHEANLTTLKLPSGEIRKAPSAGFASVGSVSNPENRFYRIGKAGKNRHRGKRPQVRGSAMNPVDHPHGGGEGRQPIGLKHPKTPWGRPALGVRTRNRKKYTNKFIVQRRKKK